MMKIDNFVRGMMRPDGKDRAGLVISRERGLHALVERYVQPRKRPDRRSPLKSMQTSQLILRSNNDKNKNQNLSNSLRRILMPGAFRRTRTVLCGFIIGGQFFI